MANNNERLGAQFTIDITNLKAGLAQANRMIRQSEAEFQEAAASMDDWSESQEGLTAKIKQLTKNLEIQQAKVDALEKEKATIIKTMEAEGKSNDEIAVAVDKVNKQLIKEYKALDKTSGELDKYTTDLEELKKEQEETQNPIKQFISGIKRSGEESKDAAGGFTVVKGALSDLASDGIKKVATELKDMLLEIDAAESKFQGMTGIANDSIDEFSESIANVYTSGVGESLNDVAESMAVIKQTFRELDVSQLEKINKNALILKETFDMDVQESVRGVDMLMKKFGLSAEEAFNLIVQGAQNGLNKNGDLLDTIDEFSTSYQRLGFTADDMFNTMQNGANSGIFQINKVGDAWNEFSIRVKDTSNTTTEAFKALGLNADEMREAFAAGGDTAREATQKTITELFKLDDAVKRNETGVALFGSFWEDMGEDAIKALTQTNGELSAAGDAMSDLNTIRFQNVNREIETLGREIKGSVSDELQKKALPAVKDFLKQLKNSGAIEKFGDLVGWVAENVTELTIGIAGAVAAYKTLKIAMNIASAVKGATSAINGFGAALSANPIGAWVTAIGAAVTAVTALVSWVKSMPSEYSMMSDAIAANTEANLAWQESLKTATVELGDYSNYVNSAGETSEQLTKRIDTAQTKISEIYQSAFSKNRQLRQDEVDAVKKWNEEYIEALNQQSQFEADKVKAQAEVLKYKLENENLSYEETQAILNKLAELESEYAGKQDENVANFIAAQQMLVRNGTITQEQMTENINNYRTSLGTYSTEIGKYYGMIEQQATNHMLSQINLGALETAAAKNKYSSLDEIEAAWAEKIKGYKEDETLGWWERNKLIGDAWGEYQENRSAFLNGEEVFYNDYQLLTDNSIAGQAQALMNWVGQVKTSGGSISEKHATLVKSILEKYENLPEDMKDEGVKSLQALAEGMGIEMPTLTGNAEDDMKTLLAEMRDEIGTIPVSTGEDVITGMQKGLNNRKGGLFDLALGIGRSVVKMINKGADVHSPSKATTKTGEELDNGLIVGQKKNMAKVLTTARNNMAQLRKVYEDTGDLSNKTSGGAGGVKVVENSKNPGSGTVNVYQTNNYAQAHSRYEIYKTKQQTAAAVRLAIARG